MTEEDFIDWGYKKAGFTLDENGALHFLAGSWGGVLARALQVRAAKKYSLRLMESGDMSSEDAIAVVNADLRFSRAPVVEVVTKEYRFRFD